MGTRSWIATIRYQIFWSCQCLNDLRARNFDHLTELTLLRAYSFLFGSDSLPWEESKKSKKNCLCFSKRDMKSWEVNPLNFRFNACLNWGTKNSNWKAKHIVNLAKTATTSRRIWWFFHGEVRETAWLCRHFCGKNKGHTLHAETKSVFANEEICKVH